LQHFGKIGTGDIVLLAEEIEKEKLEREAIQKGEDTSSCVNVTTTSTAMGEDGGEDAKVEAISTSNAA